MSNVLLRAIHPRGLLSFGPDTEKIELGPLTVLIGTNGSGKSNLLDAVSLLNHAPKDISKPVWKGGGVASWLWNGLGQPASLSADITGPKGEKDLCYSIRFEDAQGRFQLLEDQLTAISDQDEPDIKSLFEGGRYHVFMPGESQILSTYDVEPNKSILGQIQGPPYPELSYLARVLDQIKVYQTWYWGRNSPLRQPCRTDLPGNALDTELTNLPLVLNRLRGEPKVKRRILKYLKRLYEGIEDFDISLVGGTVQVMLQEGDKTISAARLSDGTLHYLCLLAILCHPEPPPLICIDEPELGLHPDIVPTVGDLLVEASERTQIIVTTHAVTLVDAMTEHPESILICERDEQGSHLRRLDPKDLAVWLETFRLGDLWTSGELGGNRW